MTNNISEGYKTKGFFGFFDVLGYRRLIEKNNLDEIIKIYNSIFLNLSEIAMLFANKPSDDYSAIKSFVFSDTIILYQIIENITPATAKYFISTSSCLLRLAFDRGIPLRGAISYGTYFIRENPICFLGKPIVEAYESEKKQNWSGAILCKSAEKIIQNISDRSEFPLIEYDVPLRSKTETERCYALRWDDSVIRPYIMLGLGAYGEGLDSMNEDQISNLVRDTFNLHKKPIDKVEQKNRKHS
jgi:hypothetical protein